MSITGVKLKINPASRGLEVANVAKCHTIFHVKLWLVDYVTLEIRTTTIAEGASEALKVFGIDIPATGVNASVFSPLYFIQGQTVDRLVIRQTSSSSSQDTFELPEMIKELQELNQLSLHGNLDSVPVRIVNQP